MDLTEPEVTHKYKLKQMYNNVLAQTVSTCSKYLFAANSFGDIFVQEVADFEKSDEPRKPVRIYPQSPSVEINSLCFHKGVLIVGSKGVLYGLRFNEDTMELSAQRKWEILIPLSEDALEISDINSLWLKPFSNTLFAAGGDNFYQIALEEARIERVYEGHTDYIHWVTGNDNNLFSVSEDGHVRIWSENQKSCLDMIVPYTNPKLARPEFGKWIGTVAVNDNWLICGGGPKFSLWHLSSKQLTNVFPFPGKIHMCDFVDDNVFVGGEYNKIQSYTINGNLTADIPVDHTASYSMVWQKKPIKFMSIAGFSNRLHILRDFRFIDCKIDLYT